MRTALYRIHYGFEFIYDSIYSVYDWADRIVVVYSMEPWYKEPTIQFQGKEIAIEHPENMSLHLKALSQIPKVELFCKEFDGPVNQWGTLVNEYSDDLVLTVECDHVFPKPEQLFEVEKELEDFIVFTNHCEYWKNKFWRVAPRPHRPGPVLLRNPVNIKTLHSNVPGGDRSGTPQQYSSTVEVDNYGFCYRTEVMFYKHILCCGFSERIKDSIPDPDWFDKWLNWTPETTNLEISKNYTASIKRAYLVKD